MRKSSIKRERFRYLARQGEVRITIEWPPKAAAWYARFKLPGQPRYYKTTKEADRDRAKEVAKRAADEEWQNVDAPSDSAADLVAAYLRVPKQDYRNNHPRLQRFLKHIGADLALARVTEERMTSLVRQFLDEREKSVAPLTLKNERVCLSGFFSWLMRTERGGRRLVPWRANPASASLHKRLVIPKRPRTLVKPEDLDALLAAAFKTDLYPALILMLSGFRPVGVSRVVSWSQFTFGEHPSVRTHEKGNAIENTLSRWAASELKRWKAEHPNTPPTSGNIIIIHRKLKMLRELTGLPAAATLQALRRTCEFKLYQSGVDPQTAARILNHSVSTALRHYVDYKKLDPSGAVDALDFSPKSRKESRKASRKTKRSQQESNLQPAD